MSLADKLRDITKRQKEKEDKNAELASLAFLEELRTKLKETAIRGEDSYQIDFTGREDLSIPFIQRELKKEGLATQNFKGNKLIISWKEAIDPNEIFKWYDLENSIDERETVINFSSESLEEVKKEMPNFYNWYEGSGTGFIVENKIVKDGNTIRLKRKTVYSK